MIKRNVIVILVVTLFVYLQNMTSLASDISAEGQHVSTILIHVSDPISKEPIREGTLELQRLTIENMIEGKEECIATCDIDNGLACFRGLEQGAYRIQQINLNKTKYRIQSFSLTLPDYKDGKEIYQVDAYPKVTTENETPPDSPKPGPLSGKLPQTGQLWWPISILAGVGLGCLIYGWKKRR